MILNANVSRKLVNLGGRSAVFAAMLLAAVPAATWALVPQGGVSTQGQTPPPIDRLSKPPAQVWLKCKVIKTNDPGREPFSKSKKEPVVSKERSPKLISAPIIRVLVGSDATVSWTHNSDETSIKLRAEADKNGGYTLTVEPRLTVGTKGQHGYIASAHLRPNEWLRCRFQDEDGNYLGLQLLVQVVPVVETP